jgi:hypothetical protein
MGHASLCTDDPRGTMQHTGTIASLAPSLLAVMRGRKSILLCDEQGA